MLATLTLPIRIHSGILSQLMEAGHELIVVVAEKVLEVRLSEHRSGRHVEEVDQVVGGTPVVADGQVYQGT